MADIAPESVLLAGAGRAILLQIAHPAIGYGVARHSDFASRPMDRLNGTLTYIYALTSGTEADKRAVRRAVNRAHRPVRHVPDAPAPPAPDGTAPTAPTVPAASDRGVPTRPGGSVHSVPDGTTRTASEAARPTGPAAAVHSVPDVTTHTAPADDAAPTHSGDPAYDARDPHLQLWVAATLYDTAITVFELVHGPLDEASADRVYREYALLGTALQMPEKLWPADRAAFRRYFDRTVKQLTVDDTVRGVAAALLRAEKAPLPIRAGMPLARFVTVALLPERVRAAFGYPWDDRRERLFRRLIRVAAPLYRALPERLRRAPHRHYLARLHAPTAT
ncbi:oxygenase MpaB family protein [Herbiconiux sp.]|uniref:oxygenase MpaB family protein n=1 Tax=Herbiconiux sp. TaxID=1871186 RepID=UPI0025BED0C5|nr:oxygenase MpaB family protein [Herbiconiux sp.]